MMWQPLIIFVHDTCIMACPATALGAQAPACYSQASCLGLVWRKIMLSDIPVCQNKSLQLVA